MHITKLKQPGHKPNTSIGIYSTSKQVFQILSSNIFIFLQRVNCLFNSFSILSSPPLILLNTSWLVKCQMLSCICKWWKKICKSKQPYRKGNKLLTLPVLWMHQWWTGATAAEHTQYIFGQHGFHFDLSHISERDHPTLSPFRSGEKKKRLSFQWFFFFKKMKSPLFILTVHFSYSLVIYLHITTL